jgi:hypothetical protein
MKRQAIEEERHASRLRSTLLFVPAFVSHDSAKAVSKSLPCP